MFPIRDNIPHKRFPIMNWILILVNLGVFLFQLTLNEEQLQSFFYLFGLVPARFSHPEWASLMGIQTDNYFPFLTNIFLHGGWLHFLTNMWTLYIFGDNVEDRMGPFRYLGFYLLVGLAASLTHFFIFQGSTIPALGSSGAISGVMAAYMLLFPYSRILLLFPILFVPFFFEIRAFIYIALWFCLQLFNGMSVAMFKGNSSGIAFWAHIGGFVAGFATFALFLRKKR
jgi:membrane associated rhomboid family serine protease